MPQPQAFLFDLDGLLVDTEDLHLRAFADVATARGLPMKKQDFYPWIGRGQPAVSAWIAAETGAPDQAQQVEVEQEQGFLALLEAERPAPRDGLGDLLELAAAEDIACAVVTSSPAGLAGPILAVILPHLGRSPDPLETFGALVTGDQVPRRKPAPDPYQIAAEQLGVEAARSVVFEDSLSGVRAGRAAGCRVVAVPCEYLVDPQPLRDEAHVAFDSLRDAVEARAWMGGA